MTPAELYAMEKAKHGVSLPRAEGCPRDERQLRKIATQKMTRRRRVAMLSRMDRTITRYKRWRAMYEEEGMSLADIATVERVTKQSVNRGLRKLGVKCRGKGWAHTMASLRSKVDELRQANAQLRAQLRLKEAA